MTNPLALLPLAIAGGGGRIGAANSGTVFEAQQLVAAGLTLLQRSAPLVRALSGKRSALLLPTSPQFLTALAASDGRGAVLLSPLATPAEIARQCADANVGAVFTVEGLADRVPKGLPVVLLDQAPTMARVITPDRTQDVDLGTHHGLSLEGERDVAGRDEEAVIVYTTGPHDLPTGAILTHRNLLANANSCADALGNSRDDHVLALLPFARLFGLTVAGSAALLSGARVTTVEQFDARQAAELLIDGVTQIVGARTHFEALLEAIERRESRLRDGALRLCACLGNVPSTDLQARWADVTGVELRLGYGLTEAGPLCLFNRHDAPNVRGSVGVAIPGVEVAISAPDGTPGEIVVRGDNVSPGYLGGAAGLPRREGWLCTGDSGVRDGMGRVRLAE